MAELFDDVHAAAQVTRALGRVEAPSPTDVAAVEQGTRDKPDGTRETYQRVEFR